MASMAIARTFPSLSICHPARDKTPKLDILSLIDHTHPSAAELLDDAVVRDGLADHWAEILGREAGQVNEGWELGGVSLMSIVARSPITLKIPLCSSKRVIAWYQ